MRRSLSTALLYFLLVGAAGFVLGPIRVLWLVPRVGERSAELLEMPLMWGVIWLSARWAARRLAGAGRAAHWGVGAAALGLMLLMELTVVLSLRGLTLEQYVESRDPVSGGVYLASLLLFAAAPALLRR